MSKPTLKTRRQFLRTTLLGSALTWTVPSFVHLTMRSLYAAADGLRIQPVTGKDAPILVVLQLAGGNDGLNTVIPLGNDHYYKARPQLAVPAKETLPLTGELALHPAMTAMKELHDEGGLALVQGVGYPNPNRSHFRSMEIWQTASDSHRYRYEGWLGKYFDNYCQGYDASVGISLTRETPQAFAGDTPKGIAFTNPKQYRLRGPDLDPLDQYSEEERFYREMSSEYALDIDENAGGSIGTLTGSGRARSAQSALDFLERTHLNAEVTSERINRLAARPGNETTYPRTRLGNQLALVAKLIGGGLSTRVYYLSQGGYDTHTNQRNAHERLLREYAEALLAFTRDLRAQGQYERVAILTFSEFGRRVQQNASGGTDHGAAAPVFIAGGRVRGGSHGAYPSLSPRDLLRGDLKHHTDFRSVYATLLEKHLEVPSTPVLGRRYPLLQFI